MPFGDYDDNEANQPCFNAVPTCEIRNREYALNGECCHEAIIFHLIFHSPYVN